MAVSWEGSDRLAGDVRAVRELSKGVQASVCIATSVEHGSATLTVVSNSLKVRDALQELKKAIAEEALEITRQIVSGEQ